ncbi:hypothetical protein CISG_09199 [Coccidioides immitis RMSCC 3703]|uniref:Uncharacterized protein n=1 Tax=Coccidioides immitis RMSCC 3703 TaxID=454286 RepID=A0A0J8R9P6_COCIT|nr:hypothetical protein CISG_09199 [Coccidioides immitis RMSCC 3703]
MSLITLGTTNISNAISEVTLVDSFFTTTQEVSCCKGCQRLIWYGRQAIRKFHIRWISNSTVESDCTITIPCLAWLFDPATEHLIDWYQAPQEQVCVHRHHRLRCLDWQALVSISWPIQGSRGPRKGDALGIVRGQSDQGHLGFGGLYCRGVGWG